MPENAMTNQEKLKVLRDEMRRNGLDGYIIPRTDEYQGEFLAPYAERLAWLTGFTGSAGYAVILQDKAVVVSDGRYTIQLKQQIDTSLYAIGNSIEMNAGEWIEENCLENARIGYDPRLYTVKQLDVIARQMIKAVLVPIDTNLIDVVWTDQPAKPDGFVSLFSDNIAGRTSVQKRKDIDFLMKDKGADALILTQGDSICWLLNVRGCDVAYTPLMLSYAILYQDGILDWLIDPRKVPSAVASHLAGVTLRKASEMESCLNALKSQKVWVDPASCPQWLLQKLGADLVFEKDPCAAFKAVKTPSEQSAIIDAHIRDGASYIRFIRWLFDSLNGNPDEITIAERLDAFRAQDPDYVGESFGAIVGYEKNGAVIHYRATPETNLKIKPEGILLLDSGGQYKSGGTTDITRSFSLGPVTDEMKDDYTRVLKGHIAISRAVFPAGTTGAQIDTLARQYLWEVGKDYAHGTGHGVGCFLGVHEDAASISPRGDKPLQAGMLLSNEPGYYKEGAYGIRIENLVFVKEVGICKDTGKTMLGFETVTLVPYDHYLINWDLISRIEKEWMHEYYKTIQDKVMPLLKGADAEYLDKLIAGLQD